MKGEKYIYCFAARLLLYLIQQTTVTRCREATLPRITLLASQTLNLSHWRDHLDVDIVALPRGNLSFYDAVEATEKVWRAAHGGQNATRAIIGSGNAIIDGLITRTAGSLAMPFISISRHENNQKQLYVNFIPSPTDRNHIVMDLAVELGCQHITVFTREHVSSSYLQQVQTTAKEHSISFKIVTVYLNDAPLSLVNLADEFYQLRNYSSVLVVLDCTIQEITCLMEASKMVFVRTVEFHWLILKENGHVTDNVELLPTGVLSIRSKFGERNWVHDALTLLNYSLHSGYERKQNNMEGHFSSNETKNLQLYRQMLPQKFRGETGWVQFDEEGHRVGSSYDIVRTSTAKSSSNGTPYWTTVGSAEGFQVSLDKLFWMEHVHVHRTFVRVVVIEEEPMLIVSKENVARDEACVLSYACIRYVQDNNHSEHFHPVKCCCTGFLMDVLNWLVKDISFEVELYMVGDGKFGSYDPVSQQWDGIIADLVSNKTDMALTTLTTTSARAKFVHFSYPFFFGETKVLISYDSSVTHGTFRFLAPFDVILWIAFLGLISAILGIVWVLERRSPCGYRTHCHSRKNRFSLSTCMSYIWSNVVKLELESMKPQSLSARFTTAVFSFCTLIVVTSYTANLAASLVQIKDKFPVTGIDDPKFQNPPPGFKFTTLQSSGTLSFFTSSDDAAYRRIGRNMMPHLVKNYTEGLDKLKNGELDAFIYDSPFIDLGASKMPGCSFRVVGSPITTKAFGVAFPKHSTWREPVTNLLLKYQRKDYFRKLTDKWFQGGCLHSKGSSQNAYRMKPANLSGLFLICCGAVATCFVILLGEYLWSRKDRKQGKYITNRIAQNSIIQ